MRIDATETTTDGLEEIFSGAVISEQDLIDRDVQYAADRMRIQQAARELLAREQAGDTVIPAPISLTDLLAMPDEEVLYRVDGLLLRGGRALLTAQFKAGKTTLTGNLVRCLADGGKFLGQFDTAPARKVTLIDTEMTPDTIKRWLRDQRISNTDAVEILPIRGSVSSFNIIDPRTRARWVELIRGSDVLILDCLRPILDALGLDEHREAGRLLVAFDELLAEAGVEEGFMVQHMGHTGERARGDSRILDWPDAIWKIVREDPEDDASPRYFSAFGRDVNTPEGMLTYDPATRGLELGGVSRQDVKKARKAEEQAERAAQAEEERRKKATLRLRAATKIVRENPQISARGLADALRNAGITVSSADRAPLLSAAKAAVQQVPTEEENNDE